MAITKKQTEAEATTATVVLTLAAYDRYHRGNMLYEKGVPYAFNEDQAAILLDETESDGRPLWKRYTSKQAEAARREPVEMVAVDMTATAVTELPEADEAGTRRIELGDDGELAAVLGDSADEAGVTV